MRIIHTYIRSHTQHIHEHMQHTYVHLIDGVIFVGQTLYEAQVVPDVLPSAVLKYLLAADHNQFGIADLAEVCVLLLFVRVHVRVHVRV